MKKKDLPTYVEGFDYYDSHLWIFHCLPDLSKLEIILEYEYDKIWAIVDKTHIDPHPNVLIFHKFVFRNIKRYSRMMVHHKVVPNPDHFNFRDENGTHCIEALRIKKIKSGYSVRFVCFSPFGSTSFQCESYDCYSMHSQFGTDDEIMISFNSENLWKPIASAD